MTYLPHINSFTSSVLLLLLIILIKLAINHFVGHKPLQYFVVYCQRLSSKVNKGNKSQGLQRVSGVMATLATLVPILVSLWLFEAFIEVPWLWQGFLLYLALGPFSLGQESKSIAQALAAKQTYYARQTLNPWVLRQTEQLSGLGLCKACIEMQLLRCLGQCFCVGFYFILAGPLGAIGYRLLLEMHYNWNVKREQFGHFGLSAAQLVNLLQWLPGRLFVLIILLGTIGQNFVLFWRLLKRHFFKANNDLVINALALALGIRLGGVVMYDGNKLRRPSFNDLGRQPEPSDIIHATGRINQVLYFALSALLLAGFITLIVSSNLFT
jgi:adenosylcobinamide-phosphate synthase